RRGPPGPCAHADSPRRADPAADGRRFEQPGDRQEAFPPASDGEELRASAIPEAGRAQPPRRDSLAEGGPALRRSRYLGYWYGARHLSTRIAGRARRPAISWPPPI